MSTDAEGRDPLREASHEDRLDVAGCFFLGLRFLGCMVLLFALQFLGIFLAALVSMIFF
jgi:hypothetical protein